jgi:glutathione synthase/RimK-type ligase-like ATP-grasp enzyme
VKKIVWGILREMEHSPDREGDDTAILRETARKIQASADVEVAVLAPEEIPDKGDPPDFIFFMCEKPEILDKLEALQKEKGVGMVNTPESVRNTYRFNTVKKLQGLPFYPQTSPIATDDGNFGGPFPLWLKRFDFHAVLKEDVCQARNPSELKTLLARFKKRGIERVLAQGHIDGDLIKFYGIHERWFEFFYHKDQVIQQHPFDPKRLEEIAKRGARELGLEVFGGDAIITKSGKIFLIDINAWPSFALYRDIASKHIADHILERIATLPSCR